MDTYIGIDPGLTGAVAVIDAGGRLVSATRTPIIRAAAGGKSQYDTPAMVELLAEHKDCRVALELVGAMPHDGVASSFRFGTGWGLWQGILAALALPTVLVRPKEWQAATLVGLPRGKAVKTSAVSAAQALFPTLPIKVKADWGMADAALMAEWCRRTHAVGGAA
jgi:crossover junction endodeoxyribonuclease RuvC